MPPRKDRLVYLQCSWTNFSSNLVECTIELKSWKVFIWGKLAVWQIQNKNSRQKKNDGYRIACGICLSSCFPRCSLLLHLAHSFPHHGRTHLLRSSEISRNWKSISPFCYFVNLQQETSTSEDDHEEAEIPTRLLYSTSGNVFRSTGERKWEKSEN